MNDDDWGIKKKDGLDMVVGEDLEGHSIEDLDERLTMLGTEIERVKQIKIKKSA